MTISKWLMKQYWRVGTIRTISGIGLGMLVLGRFYHVYIPGLADMGLIGAIILAIALILLFLAIGWVYDTKLKMWNEKIQVEIERNPYHYVPPPGSYMLHYPVMYAMIHTLSDISHSRNRSSASLRNLSIYFENYFARSPSSKTDIKRALPESAAFMANHEFNSSAVDSEQPHVRRNLKKGFQLHTLRLTWIQALTSLLQDVLVLGALYATILFPDVVTNGAVPTDYLLLGILVVSLPLYILMLIAGWFYDRRLKMWSYDIAVRTERNPFQYVPSPEHRGILMPFFYATLHTMNQMCIKAGTNCASIQRISEYLENYLALSSSKNKDFQLSLKLRASYGAIFTVDSSKQGSE